MCRHYQGSLDVIVLLQASLDQTKTLQEDADKAMEKNHEKNRQGAQESKERDGSETGRERPVPFGKQNEFPTEMQVRERDRYNGAAALRGRA
jgi:hypothetical protein